MGSLKSSKEFNLTAFSGIVKFSIPAWKDMSAVFMCHTVKIVAASLGQYDGLSFADGRKVCCVGFAAGTDTIMVCFKTWMKGKNHQ